MKPEVNIALKTGNASIKCNEETIISILVTAGFGTGYLCSMSSHFCNMSIKDGLILRRTRARFRNTSTLRRLLFCGGEHQGDVSI